MFPFTDSDEADPVTGATDSLLRRARASDTVPKLFHILTNSEYFNRSGSLVHTNPSGTKDAILPDTSRVLAEDLPEILESATRHYDWVIAR